MNQFLYHALAFAGYYRGDVDMSGAIDNGDVIRISKSYFGILNRPEPFKSQADVNKDYTHNSADAIYLFNYLFKSGPAPIDYARFPAEIPFDDRTSLFNVDGDWDGFRDLYVP